VIEQQKSLQSNEISAIQCKMARAALGWGIRDLARAAQVAPQTVNRLEKGDRLKPRTVESILVALETAGIEFIPQNGGGPGVRMKHRVNGG
jgi:DNA-binding XRE family transcriptional regulator